MDSEARLDRAEEALAAGDVRAAIIDARSVLQDEPDNVRGRLLLGRAALAAGDGPTAEKELRRAIDLGTPLATVAVDLGQSLLLRSDFQAIVDEIVPSLAVSADERAVILKMRGDAYLGLRKIEAARESFTAALRENPELLDAQLGTAATYEAERNFVQARGTLDQILSNNPGYASGWLASGNLDMRMGNPERAASSYRQVVRTAEEQSDDSHLVRGLIGLADALLAQDNVDEARPIAERLSNLAPGNIFSQQLTARIAYIDKEWERAQQILQGVLQVAPNFRPAQMLLGAVHLQSGQLAQAEMYLSAVVAANPENFGARQLLAETRLRLDHLDEAKMALGPMLKGDATDLRALQMATRASLRQGNVDEAVEFLDRSLAADPDNDQLKLQAALTYINLGRLDAAEELLRSMGVSSVGDSTLQRDILLIMAEIRRKDLEAAYAASEALLESHPDSAAAHNIMGTIHLEAGEYTAARNQFTVAEELQSNPVLYFRNLASVDEAEGRYDAAGEHYRRILEMTPDAAWVMVALARLAQYQEDPTAAREWLERARGADSGALLPRQVLGRYYLATGEYHAAEAVVREIVELDRANAEAWSMLGTALLNLEQPSEAAESYREARRLQPEELSYRVALARALDAQGKTEMALQELELAPGQVAITDVQTAVMAASLRAKTGDLGGAMNTARSLVEAHPDQALAHALVGEMHANAGNFVEAAAAYDRVLELETNQRFAARAFGLRSRAGRNDRLRPLEDYLSKRPLDTEVRKMLAAANLEEGRTEEAMSQYERVLAIDPDDGTALNNLAWVYLERGDERAEATARRALEMLPGNTFALDTLGWILVQKGSAEEGVEVLRRAVATGGDRPEVKYHLAVGLAKAGQRNQARQLLQEALSSEVEFTGREAAEELLLEI